MQLRDHNKHIQAIVNRSQIPIGTDMTKFNQINIQEIHLYNRYNNVSQELGNNLITYDVVGGIPSSFIMADGFYNLDSVNDNYLLVVLHKLVLAPNGINYLMLEYGNLNDWQSESNPIGDKTLLVKDSTVFNTDVWAGLWPLQHINMLIQGINQERTGDNGGLTKTTTFIVPIMNDNPGDLQSIYFNDGIWYENGITTSLDITFQNYKNQNLVFSEPYPRLVLHFDNVSD